MTYVYELVFLHITVNFFFIAYLFYRSQNGRLRLYLIWYFTSLGCAAAIQMVGTWIDANTALVGLLAGVPVSITGSFVCHHMFKTYWKRRG